MEIVSGEDAYPIILRSCYKKYIPRNLGKEEPMKEGENLIEEEESYFDSDVEYVEEDKLNATDYKKEII